MLSRIRNLFTAAYRKLVYRTIHTYDGGKLVGVAAEHRFTGIIDRVANALETAAHKVVTNKYKFLLAYIVIGYGLSFFGLWSWWVWSIVLVAQNLAFTFVSRARNSGSIMRHLVAGIFSNGIFVIQFAFLTSGKADAMLHGKDGVAAQVFIALFYTLFTLTGSVLAHTLALLTEAGKGAVGASKKYAQVPVEEYRELKESVAALMQQAEMKAQAIASAVEAKLVSDQKTIVNNFVGYTPAPTTAIPSSHAGGTAGETK